MGSRYFIYCETCQQSSDFDAGSWEKRLLYVIIAHAGQIPSVGALLEASEGNLKLGADDNRRLDPKWFAAHVGHSLVVISDYGLIDDRCGEPYTCGQCQTHHYCNLPKGHTETEHAGRVY